MGSSTSLTGPQLVVRILHFTESDFPKSTAGNLLLCQTEY